MSRCLTLEEYLREFVDEKTDSSVDEVKLLVTNEQAQTLGFFLIHGLAGFIECSRLQSPRSADECFAKKLKRLMTRQNLLTDKEQEHECS